MEHEFSVASLTIRKYFDHQIIFIVIMCKYNKSFPVNDELY